MSLFAPRTITLPETAPDDPRVGHWLGHKAQDVDEAQVVLLGFGSDEGVRRNGGRPGAAQAPDAIRQVLYKLTPDARAFATFVEVLDHTVDLGNLILTESMEENQERLGAALAPYLRRGALPIILGGGHETSFGHFLGYVQAEQPVRILNWDAHADVRPLKDERGHSGSPFRQALTHASGLCEGYTVAGLAPHSTARTHLDFLREHEARFFWNADLTPTLIKRLYTESAGSLMVTFDMDAVEQAAAPGVSAPAAQGMPTALWLKAAYEAGHCRHTTSIDLVEVNPVYDIDHRTARLAALTVWQVLRGLAERASGYSLS
ncbi:MAG TPA: formimidoylglutamase [Rhodothermales bacterium]|nr:formimidoylglutamase [Rhodothermales bacterium]